MNATATSERPSSADGFRFVQKLAADLSSGKIDLPAFPDIVARVRRALQDDDINAERLAQIIGAEPALTLRLMQIANSAAMGAGRKAAQDLRSAIRRIGFDVVRTSTVAFAMAQLNRNEALKPIRVPLNKIWQRSALVAAMAHVLAKHVGGVSPDTAALAGVLHGIGKLYILVNAADHPELFGDLDAYLRIEQQWHSEIAKALLENWKMSEDVIAAVHQQENTDYQHEGAADLTDVLIVAELLVQHRERRDGAELQLGQLAAAARMQLDGIALKPLLVEWEAEISALRAALVG